MRFTQLFFSAVVVIVLLLLPGCEDEPVMRDYPNVKTYDVSSVSDTGAVFNGEVVIPEGVQVIDHGFIWGTSSTLSITYGNRVMLGSMSAGGVFSQVITTSLAEGKKYYLCAYAKTDSYMVYGVVREFVSLGSKAPEITGFSPEYAGWYDTVSVQGKGFSWDYSMNNLYVGNTKISTLTMVTDTLLKFVFPAIVFNDNNLISVELAGSTATFVDDTLVFLRPEIVSVDPLEAAIGDTVTVIVKNISDKTGASKARLFIGTKSVTAFENNTAGRYRFIIPSGVITNNISVTIFDYSMETSLTMEINDSKIFSGYKLPQ